MTTGRSSRSAHACDRDEEGGGGSGSQPDLVARSDTAGAGVVGLCLRGLHRRGHGGALGACSGDLRRAGALATIVRLAQHLDDTATPIDYARRRSLEYSALLPPAEWESIAITQNVHTGSPRRAVLARAYLHRLLSGDRTGRLVPAGEVITPVTDSDVNRFSRTAPLPVLAALHAAGVGFLQRAGVDEPPTWCPSPGMVAAELHAVSVAVEKRDPWSPRRPARGAPDGDRAVSIRWASAEGLSRRATAGKLGLSRQSIARTLAAEGVPAKPGRRAQFRIDPDWLAEQRDRGQRSVADLAREVGCSATTIRRHLRAAVAGRRSARHDSETVRS